MRARRKALMYPIMYGTLIGATEDEISLWREMAAEYINGERELREVPATLSHLRHIIAGKSVDSIRPIQ